MNRKTLALAVSLVAPWTLGCEQAEVAPPPPTLGEQIDRMGRPGVTTTLVDPLNLNGERDQLQNQYNADQATDQWLFNYRPRFAANVALIDGVDGVCGNSLLRRAGAVFNSSARYDNIAIPFAYDALFLDTGKGNCAGPFSYLAVERGVNLFPADAANDCGGRPPTIDVIDATYTAFIQGRGGWSGVPANPSCTAATEAQVCPGGRCNIAAGSTTGTCAPDPTRVITYPDGVAADAPAPSLVDFPFLAAPR